MTRSRVHSVVRRGSKRLVDWELGIFSTGFTAVAEGSKVLVASFSAAALDPVAPATIVRTRLRISVESNQVIASEDQLGAFGLSFQNEVARALGVTGLAGPVTDFNFDWFVYQPICQRTTFVDGTGFRRIDTEYEIDSKAMRKFSGGSALVIMAENISSTDAFRIAVEGRILIKAG